MSKSKTNFNTFLRECEEYESIGMKKNNHASSHSNNIFLNSKMNGNDDGGGTHGGVGVVDVSKLILNDDNFPSLSSSSSKQKPNTNKTDIKTEKVDFKKALASSPPLLLQQQQQQQKQQQQQQQRMAAISAASKCTLVKKESEYIAKKFIMSKRYSTLNGMSSLDCDDYDDYDDDDEDDGNIIDDE